MRYLIIFLILCGGVLRADLTTVQSAHPRLMDESDFERIRVKMNANTRQWQVFKAYMDNNLNNGNPTSKEFVWNIVHLLAIMHHVTGDPAYRARSIEIGSYGLTNYFAGAHVVTNATAAVVGTSNVTVITVAQPHGFSTTARPRLYPSFFTGNWSGFWGEINCTTPTSTTFQCPVNSSTRGAFVPTGDERLFVSDFGANESRNQWWKFALAFDLNYDGMSTAQRNQWIDFLAAVHHFGARVEYWGSTDIWRDVHGNLGTGRFMYQVFSGAALWGHHPVAQQYWPTVIERANWTRNVMLNGILKGGGFPEGKEYGPQSAMYIGRALRGLKAATNDSSINDAIEDWWDRYMDENIHSTSPAKGGHVYYASGGRWQQMPEGDAESAIIENISQYQREAVLHGVNMLLEQGKTDRAARFKDWIDTVSPNPNNLGLGAAWYEEIQYYPESLTPQPFRPASTQTNYLTEGHARIYSRTDWTANATWFGMDAGVQGTDHLHASTAGFHIWRKGKWLTRKQLGYGGAGFWPYGNNAVLMGGRGTLSRGLTDAQSAAATALMPITWAAGFDRTHFPSDNRYIYARTTFGKMYHFRAEGRNSVDTATYRDMYWDKQREIWVFHDYAKFKTGYNRISSFLLQSLPFFTHAVNGRRVTLTEPDTGQKLYMDVVHVGAPTANVTPVIVPRQLNYSYVWMADPGSGTNLHLVWDTDPSSPWTLSGATGDWAGLNGTFTRSTTVSPTTFQDWGGSDKAHKRLGGINTTGVTTDFVGQVVRASGLHTFREDDALDPRRNYTRSWVFEASSNQRLNAQDHVFVLRANDAADAAPALAARLTATNFVATQVGDLVVAFVPGTTPTLPATYTYDGAAATAHRMVGLTPGASYNCNTATPNSVTLNTGTGCLANSAGVIELALNASGTVVKQLALNPTSRTVSCLFGSGLQTPDAITVGITGGGGAWTGSSNQPYLALSNTSGSGSTSNLEATVNCGALAVGTHSATLTFTSADAANSPQTIPYTINVTQATTVSVPAGTVQFAYDKTAAVVPDAQTVQVTVTGAGASVTASEAASWLSVSPTTAFTSTQTLTITAGNAAALNALANGAHTANITLTITGATPSSITIPVTIQVTQQTITASASAGQIDMSVRVGESLVSQAVSVSISSGTLPFTAAITGPCSVTPLSGNLSTSGTAFDVAPLASISFGDNACTLTITVPGASNSPLVIPVTITYGPEPDLAGFSNVVTDTAAVVTFGAPDSRATTVYWSTSPNMIPVIGSTAQTGPVLTSRLALLAPLSPATEYYWYAESGTLVTRGSFKTRGAAAGTGALFLRLTPRPGIGAAKVRIEHGLTTALSGTPVVVDCASGCTPSIPATLGAMVYYRYTYLNAGEPPVAVAPTSNIRSDRAR